MANSMSYQTTWTNEFCVNRILTGEPSLHGTPDHMDDAELHSGPREHGVDRLWEASQSVPSGEAPSPAPQDPVRGGEARRVLNDLHSPRFADSAPAEIHAYWTRLGTSGSASAPCTAFCAGRAPTAREAVGSNPTDRGKHGSKHHILVDGRGARSRSP